MEIQYYVTGHNIIFKTNRYRLLKKCTYYKTIQNNKFQLIKQKIKIKLCILSLWINCDYVTIQIK
jgi:hypothetical protein